MELHPTMKLPADLERKLEQLPLLPAVVSEILDLDSDADDYFDRLLHLAERDPPFAIRVLRCANSAYSAPVTPIVSLRDAVMRLGTQQCAALVLTLAVVKVFLPKSDAQRFLWIHSLQTALFARMFCQRIPAMRRSAVEAYVCGLLHDIGRFVQFEGAPADLSRVDDTHWASPQELLEVERIALGYDYALLGWHACKKWSLPDTIGNVVRHHHDPVAADSNEPLNLIRIVQSADALSVALTMKPELVTMSSVEFACRLAAEHPRIGVGFPAGIESSWQSCIPDLYEKSLVLALQLHLLSSRTNEARSLSASS